MYEYSKEWKESEIREICIREMEFYDVIKSEGTDKIRELLIEITDCFESYMFMTRTMYRTDLNLPLYSKENIEKFEKENRSIIKRVEKYRESIEVEDDEDD